MVIVALDDRGFELAEQLTESTTRRPREFWNSETRFEEKWNEHFKTSSEKAKAEASFKRLRSFGDLFPYLRRILTPDVQTFDLRGRFETALSEVEEYLRNTTRFAAIWPGHKYALLQQGINAYLLVSLFIFVLLFGSWVWFLVSHVVF